MQASHSRQSVSSADNAASLNAQRAIWTSTDADAAMVANGLRIRIVAVQTAEVGSPVEKPRPGYPAHPQSSVLIFC